MMMRALFLSFLLLLAGPAFAEPSDELFEKLKNAPSESEAHDISLDIWASWMESGSPTVDLIMHRAIAAQKAGDLETARAFYDRAILIKPDNPESWNRRATIFLAEENYSEALRDINRTLTLEPRHFGAWTGLGIILETLGAEKEALEAFREALEIYPYLPQAKQGVARLRANVEGQGL